MFKKVLTIMLVLIGMVTLAACGNTETPVDPVDELTTLEKISEAMDQLDLPGSASSNLTLVTSGLHDVVISWSSDNTDVIANDGTVTIPLFTDGDQTVTLTASLTLDGETLTKTFDIDVDAATEMSDQEKADLAAVAFNGLYSGAQVADFTLPATGLHGTTVTWASDNTDVVTNDGMVTRPSFEDGNVVVHLTGTVTSGTATATVVLTVTITAEGEVNTYASIAAIYASAVLDEEIEFTGIVTSTFNGGYFLTDGTDVLGIYAGNNDFVVAKGDEVKVKGSYAVYNSLYQLGSISQKEILSSGNDIVITPMETTIAGLLALDSTDKTIHGKYYTVTGTVGLFGDYDNVVLIDGADQVMVYYQSDPTSLAALEAEVGKEVTVTVVYYTDHSRDGVIVAYDNGAEGIGFAELTDEEALAADVAALQGLLPGAITVNVDLPTMAPNGSSLVAWTSMNPALLSNSGMLLDTVTENTLVSFSVTLVKGNEMQVVTVDVMITPMNTPVADLLAMDLGTYANINGIVYELSYYGFFVVDNGAYIFVKMDDFEVVVGDEVTILGNTGIYNGLVQVVPMNDVVTIESQGNADPVVTIMGTVEGLLNDLYPRGSRVQVTATVAELTVGNYTNTYLQGVAGGQVQVYYRSNAGELDSFFDTVVTLTVVTYHNELVLYQGVEADVTTGAAFDDAGTAQAIADTLDLGNIGNLNVDLDLPLANVDPVATIAWATSDAAVITEAGVVTLVSGANPSATLTATVTVGSETATRDFVVTLMDLNDNVPLTVTETLAKADGTEVLVKGVVVGVYYDEVIIQDDTGAAIYIDSNVEGMLGDEIVVVGTLGTNIDYGDNQRIIANATKLETLNTGVALVVSTETDVATIISETPMMYRYTAELTVSGYDGYGYVIFNADSSMENGIKFKLSQEGAPEYFKDFYPAGETITLTFTVSDIDFSNTRVVSVDGFPVMTDADYVAGVVTYLGTTIPTTVTSDMTLPTEVHGVTISWASDNAAITDAGVVTRPANGDGDVSVTLTAVITFGVESQTETFVISVSEEEPPPVPGLFISEYIEGGSYNKAVELYNPTGAAIDLTGFTMELYGNGSATATGSIDLTGQTIAAGGTLVICNTGSNAAILAVCDIQNNSIANWNGDDAVALLENGTIIDVIGVVGTDPGSFWEVGTDSTQNHTLVRDPSVVSGTTVWDPNQWIAYDQDTIDYLGTHTVN